LRRYYFETRVLTFGSTTLVIAGVFFVFMAWYVTRHHADIAMRQRLGSFRRRLSPRLHPDAAAGSSQVVSGGDTVPAATLPGAVNLFHDRASPSAAATPADAATRASSTSHLSHSRPATREQLPLLMTEGHRVQQLPAAGPVDIAFKDNLKTTAGVILISILILVAYSYCQVFTWIYVTYATGNDSLQVIMSTVFQVRN
jgi:hypothetical protein